MNAVKLNLVTAYVPRKTPHIPGVVEISNDEVEALKDEIQALHTIIENWERHYRAATSSAHFEAMKQYIEIIANNIREGVPF